MPRSLLIALCAALLGAVAGIALVETVLAKEKKEFEFGGVKVPIEYTRRIYDRDQLRIGVATGAGLAALLAVGFGSAAGMRRRRR